MKVFFRQIYIEEGVQFSFSIDFQGHISKVITALLKPSEKFIKKYGEDFDLVFNVSAKRGLLENEIRGPAVFKKTKDVEYTIFLPFDVITRKSEVAQSALEYLLAGAICVFEKLEFDTANVLERQGALIEEICSDPAMFKTEDELKLAARLATGEGVRSIEHSPNMAREFPNDDNGAVLQTLFDAGIDLTVEHDIEFMHVLPDEKAADAMQRHLRQLGLNGDVVENELDGEFDVAVVVRMIPSHAEITRVEKQLAALAESNGGRPDGWGIEQAR